MRTESTGRVYKNLLRLYPRAFRDQYGDDLLQIHTDLSAELGPRRAWRRVTLDLIVTVPRYRIETLMKQRHTSTVLTAAIVVMACVGIVSPFAGLYPGALLLPLAMLVAVTQRSKLARSMDVTDSDRLRQKRLKASAMLAASLPVIYLVSLPILGDDWGTDAVVAFGVWVAVLIAAACYFVAGISTPKSPAATH
ncbi:MAG: hypothetical protein ABIQ73_07385 [Acidimicrobiales bacterium]